MSDAVLTVQDVSKKFCLDLKRSLWYGVKDIMAEFLLKSEGSNSLRKREFWALSDISFNLIQGETLGIVGPNGAGKSTLLKLINGLIRPDLGFLGVKGRVGALIALGSGFNPILTGRENVYIYGAVLGLSRSELERRLDEIIEFAEIGEFIDSPVQVYSSGMVVRLGFSVASTLNPHILLVDEVLSVGDASFRERSYHRLNEYRQNGGSVIFVSHNSDAVHSVADRVMRLDRGRIVEIGEPGKVLEAYERQMKELGRHGLRRIQGNYLHENQDAIWFTNVATYDASGSKRSNFEFGESFEVCLEYATARELTSPYFVIGVQREGRQGSYVSYMSMQWDQVEVGSIPRHGIVRCVIDVSPYSPGSYNLYAGVQATESEQLGAKWHTSMKELGNFTVEPGTLTDRFPGMPPSTSVSMPLVLVSHKWEIEGLK